MALDTRPWRPKYHRDWRTSRAVRLMTWAQRGIYDWLLDEQWEDGGLPKDPADVAQMIAAPVADVARVLELAFEQDADGQWWNQRGEQIRAEQDERSEAGRAGGRASGEARRRRASQSGAGQSDRGDERIGNDSATEVERSGNDPSTIHERSANQSDSDAESDPDSDPGGGEGTAPPSPPPLEALGVDGQVAHALTETGVWADQWRAHVGKNGRRLAEQHVPATFEALVRDFGDAFVAARVRAYDRWRRSKPAKVRGRKRHDTAIRRWVEKDAAGFQPRRPAALSDADREKLRGA